MLNKRNLAAQREAAATTGNPLRPIGMFFCNTHNNAEPDAASNPGLERTFVVTGTHSAPPHGAEALAWAQASNRRRRRFMPILSKKLRQHLKLPRRAPSAIHPAL